MNNITTLPETVQQEMASIRFPILSAERYLSAVNASKELVRKNLELPLFEDFKAVRISKFSPRLTKGILAMLFIVMAVSFWISIGKQIAVNGMILDSLPGRFNHLSTFWSDTSIIAMLLLSELGTVLFLIASGTIADAAPTWQIANREINLIGWIFRIFALLCAGFAIVGNVSETVLDPVPSVAAMQWLAAIGIPCIVLGLGLMLEQIIIESVRTSGEQKAAYQVALVEYQRAVKEPETHPLYKRSLFDSIYAEITRYKPDRQKLANILSIVEQSQEAKIWFVTLEFQAHMRMAAFDLSGEVTGPFLATAPLGSE